MLCQGLLRSTDNPFLSGKLASEMINGVQSRDIAATVKHFVANEQEAVRFTVNETISERALREIYLRPFEIAVKEASPWTVMTAYNHINGTHCDANEWLLRYVLRGQWGREGLVLSDSGGTNAVAQSLRAGLDLEMPGPPRMRRIDALKEAIRAGELNENRINDRARQMLQFRSQVGAFKIIRDAHERSPSR